MAAIFAGTLQVGGEKAPWPMSDGATAEYFKETPFRGHTSTKRLGRIMNFSMPGLEKVAAAYEKGDDFAVGPCCLSTLQQPLPHSRCAAPTAQS